MAADVALSRREHEILGRVDELRGAPQVVQKRTASPPSFAPHEPQNSGTVATRTENGSTHAERSLRPLGATCNQVVELRGESAEVNARLDAYVEAERLAIARWVGTR